MNKQAGFTLLEILVALAVFAILSSVTAGVMYNAFNTRERVNQQANELNNLQLSLMIISRDVKKIASRSVRGEGMRLLQALVGQSLHLEFTRDGVVNTDSKKPHSTLQRITYTCTNHQLVRRRFDALDAPDRQLYQDKLLLKHLDECRWAYLDHNLQVVPEWPSEPSVDKNQNSLPAAVQLTLTLHEWGNMSLLFMLPEEGDD